MKKTQILILLILTICSMIACGNFDSNQRETAEDAIKALKKLDSATSVGMNKMQYSSLLIEAKTTLDNSLTDLPEGELKNELKASMDAYVDANNAWNGKILASDGTNLTTKYGRGEMSPLSEDLMENEKMRNLIIDLVWLAARTHLENASTLMKK